MRFDSRLFNSSFVGGGLFHPMGRLLSLSTHNVIFSRTRRGHVLPHLLTLTSGEKFSSMVSFLVVLGRLTVSPSGQMLYDPGFARGRCRMGDEHVGVVRRCLRGGCDGEVAIKRITGLVGVARSKFYRFFGGQARGDFVSFLGSLHINRTTHVLLRAAGAVSRVSCGYNFGGVSGFGHVFGGGGNSAPASCEREGVGGVAVCWVVTFRF